MEKNTLVFLLCQTGISFSLFALPEGQAHSNVNLETAVQGDNRLKTIVPLEEQIDEDHARLELAKLLSYNDQHLNESLENYFILLNKFPHEIEFQLAIGKIFIRKKEFKKALSILYQAIQDHPLDPDLLLEASRAERGLGHAEKSEKLILKAINVLPSTAVSRFNTKLPFLLDYAETLMLIGSFYQAEDIYKEAIEHQDSQDLSMKLAWAYVSSGRYSEAEGIYRKLLWQHPNSASTIEALANLKIIQKDFCLALEWVEQLLSLYPYKPSYNLLRGQILFKNEDYLEAVEQLQFILETTVSRFIIENKDAAFQALILLGRTYKKLGDESAASEAFQQAYAMNLQSVPQSIELQFYLAGEEVNCSEFLNRIIAEATQPENLQAWSTVFSENGMGGIVEFHEKALILDPDYYPAQISLGDALSSQYRYDEAVDQYLSLLKQFPNASKLLMSIARVYSWSKEYRCSFEWYDTLIELNPVDPVPRIEKARVAYWGYYFDLSMATYQTLLRPPVDQLLYDSLKESENPFICAGLELMTEALACGSIYSGYEAFAQFFQQNMCEFNSWEKHKIEWTLIEFLSDYLIQKGVFLEKEAKRLDWKNNYFHALPIYRSLADFSPGNEEGLYSYAQDFCSLGLCRCSRAMYDRILNIDPNHNLVKMALQRNLMKENWLLQSNYTYWKERGLGQFSQSQIARHRFDQIAQWSPACNFHLRFIQNEYLERPFITHGGMYRAEGQTLEVDKQINPYIKGAASATYKTYFNRFPSRYTGFANLWFNCYDYFNLGIGYERQNEIYNYFSLKEAIQSKNYWASITSNLTHYWNMGMTYWHSDYNDKNTMKHIEVLTSYTFTDDPNVFKIILQGSYRNTTHLTKIITNPSGQITNVIHPYWTPQDYYSNSITLEYRHNFAFFNYCEGPSHYLDLQLTGEEDTARNPSLQLTFEWRRDFFCHWGFSVKGMIHQSRLWNAEGAWVNAYYQF